MAYFALRSVALLALLDPLSLETEKLKKSTEATRQRSHKKYETTLHKITKPSVSLRNQRNCSKKRNPDAFHRVVKWHCIKSTHKYIDLSHIYKPRIDY